MNKRITYLIVALLCLLGGQSAWAQEFDSDDGMLHYKVYDAENFPLNVEVGKTDATTGNITIPATVTYDGTTYNVVRTCDYAFSNCEALTGITFSEGLVQINGASFESCTNLASVSLPNTLISIGGYGFYNCTSLKTLVIPGSVVAFPDAPAYTFGGNVFNSITFESSATALPYELEVRAKNVILNRNGGRFHEVESVVIGGSATEISNEAFTDCTELSSVTIQSAISFIDYHAFWACTSLKDFTIPASVTTIGADAFGYCVFDNLTIEQAASTLDFVGYKLAAVNAVVNRPTISNESGNLFYNHLQTLTVGGSVTSVPNNFVDGCENLTTVTLGSSVTSIGNDAFKDCAKLTTIDIQGNVTSIGDRAFYECYELSGISLQSTLQSIGGEAFYKCTSIKNLTVPSAVATLGNDAFAFCVFDNLVIEDSNTLLDLGSYSLNAHNAYIGRPVSSDRGEIFWNVAYNEEKFDGTLEIGGNVTTLTTQYAHNLSYMTKLILGNSVQSIEEKALGECSSLADMYVPWQTPLAINANVFEDYYDQNTLPQNATLWVPAGTKAAYQAATGWNMFANIQPTHYIVNLNTVGDGTLKVNDTATRVLVAYDATNIEFVLAAGEDYDFASLNDGTSNVYTPASQGATLQGGTYTLASIDDDMTFTATFTEKPKFNIAAVAGVGGTVNVQGGEYGAEKSAEVYRDRDAVVGIKCNDNYEIVSVVFDKDDVTSQLVDGKFTIANIQGAHQVNVTFQKINLDVTLVATQGGSLTVGDKTATVGQNKTAVIARGQNVQMTATPDEDYDFTGIKQGENIVYSGQRTGGTYTHENLQDEPTFTAIFTIKPLLTITASATNGTVTPSEQQVRRDRNAVITLIPDEGHYLSALTVNGNDAKGMVADNTLTISDVQEDQVVVAAFTKYVYNVTAAAATNGTVELAATSVEWGGNTSATITPAEGYMIEHVYINNVMADDYLDGNTLSINDVKQDTEVSASFRILSYRVNITGADVTVSNEYPQHGEQITITVAEDPDRELTSLKINGVENKGGMVGNTLTITVTENINVVAEFKSTVEVITISSLGVSTYACDQDLNFTGSELKAYITSGFNKNTGSVLLTRVYEVPAGTGVYLKGNAGSYKIPYSSANYYYSNMLKGNISGLKITLPTTSTTPIGECGNYILTNNNGVPTFVISGGSATVGNKRAYLQIPTEFFMPSTDSKIGIVFEEDLTDGIADFVMFNHGGNNSIYNLNGQKVNNAARGVYIINGKKVVKK